MFAGADDIDSLVASPLFVGLQTLGAAGPSIVALGLNRWLGGKGALRQLLGRFKPAMRFARWYLVAVAVAPILTVLAMAVGRAMFDRPFVDPESGLADLVAEMGWVGAVAVLPAVLLSQVFSSPILEEAGWRGFALPRLQARAGALTASVALGVVWGVWHLPLVVAYEDPFAPYLFGIVAYTILMTWVFNSAGGNMFAMLLFHASLNLSLNVLLPFGAGWTPMLIVGDGGTHGRGRARSY